MTYDRSRFWAFRDFACGRDGNALRRRIHAMARHYVSGHAAKLDPNWHSVDVRFNREDRPQKLLEHTLADKEACRVDFDYRPTEVILVGPTVGHVLLTDRVFDLIPEPLIALMRMYDVFKRGFHTLRNLDHVIELIDGRTVIEFENCVDGVVRNIRGEEFDVEDLDSDIELAKEQRHYTRERLFRELEIEGMFSQVVGITYLPYLPRNGRPRDTPEAIREVCRIEREEAERVHREIAEATG